MFAQTRPVFDLSGLDVRYMGLIDLIEADRPYEPSPEDMAWCLGYETEHAGESAIIRTRDGYSDAQHLAFAMGQRQARKDMTRKAPTTPLVTSGPEDLAAMLRVSAGYCEAQGGGLGEFLSNLIRNAAKDVEYYRASSWQEYSAREAEMIEALQDCDVCRKQAYLDRM